MFNNASLKMLFVKNIIKILNKMFIKLIIKICGGNIFSACVFIGLNHFLDLSEKI